MDGGLGVDVFLCASDFPFGKTEEGCYQEPARAPFFLRKGPSWKTFPRNVFQFTPENAPCGIRVSLPAGSDAKGFHPFGFPTTF